MNNFDKYILSNTLDNTLIELDKILCGLSYKIVNLDNLSVDQIILLNRIKGHISNIQRIEDE